MGWHEKDKEIDNLYEEIDDLKRDNERLLVCLVPTASLIERLLVNDVEAKLEASIWLDGYNEAIRAGVKH